jgi:hypothetical protein
MFRALRDNFRHRPQMALISTLVDQRAACVSYYLLLLRSFWIFFYTTAKSSHGERNFAVAPETGSWWVNVENLCNV